MVTEHTKRTAEEARQGERGRPVVKILAASLFLAVVTFAGLGILQTAGVVPTIGAIESPEKY
ncbi:hypothetical protein [Roseibium sp.]|uniref:hypothetical protein n=1 Tax=Roseibium sp. TaxID=1936156 RepID=UPI00391928AA